ncbi:MAG: hypothetical protein AAF078_12055 [Planctomycetota bacterium]
MAHLPKPIPPRTVLRLVKLWPHARKQGREVGQVYRVGYYCRGCGRDTVWLVNRKGEYSWTADRDFIERHFKVVELSRERSLYGKGKPKLGPLADDEYVA